MSFTALLLLSGVVVGAALAFLRHPVYGLFTYVVVYFVSPQSRWWGADLPTNRWALLTAVVLLIAVGVRRPRPHAIPLFRHKFVWGLLAMVVWLAIQSAWALNSEAHVELLELFIKYFVLVILIYASIETEKHLKIFLWAHVAGGVYLGWYIYSSYTGGRFEGTGVPGANDANSAAMLLVTVAVIAGTLFLSGRLREKAALLIGIPLVINGLVATVSRSGFLALAVSGTIFNVFTPARYRKLVRVLSVLALVLFLLLTNPLYWSRIETMKYAGEQVEGVDTAHSRLLLIKAQWQMFQRYPLGCGHRCTVLLSPQYLDNRYLTGPEDNRGRASHNTFMTLLVEQGIPGAAMYLLFLGWLLNKSREFYRIFRGQQNLLAQVFPAVLAVMGAMSVGDLFVDYLKFEARFWFAAVLMLLQTLPKDNAAGGAIPRGPP